MSPRCTVAFLAAALAALSACPPSSTAPSSSDAGPARAVADAGTGAPGAKGRPPYPNMATAAWGQRVLEERLAALPPGAMTTDRGVLDALHELTPQSAARAADVAGYCYRAASTDVARANCLALMAAALVLDPTVEGYKERLTDAWGLASYAGSLDASDSLGQSARALVAAAVGAVAQSERLVETVETTPKLGTEPRLFLGLARRTAGNRGDAMIADLEAALAARPASARARAALAETWLDFGLAAEAIRVATVDASLGPAAQSPWLDAVRGRALVVDGKVDEGIALLKAAEPKLDEGQRGDALYWLGRSLTSQPEASRAEVDALVASLGARAGFAKEGTVLRALLLQRAGDFDGARKLLEPIVRGPPSLPVDVDAAWLLADACAAGGDLRCVDAMGGRALAIDGDEARFQFARAASVLLPPPQPPSPPDAGPNAGPAGAAPEDRQKTAQGPLREAFRAAPFDAALAKKLGESGVVSVAGLTPAQSAARLRAARRALLRHAPKVLEVALAPLAKAPACRVCRALEAQGAAGIDAAKKGALAIAGAGAPLCEADLVRVIGALGAAPLPETQKALDGLDKGNDSRPAVTRAIAQARADHADPDGRRRRDADARKRPLGMPAPTPGLAAPRPPGPAKGAP